MTENNSNMETPEPNMFEDVWLFAYYPIHKVGGFISEHDDNFIRGVMTRNDGVIVGSGCMLVEPFERDIQCRIKRRRAEAVTLVLEGAGYRTTIQNIPPETKR